MIIQTDLDGVNVVTPVAERREHDRGRKPVSVEVVVHVFTLERPARCKHVFQASTYRVAIAMTAIIGSEEGGAAEIQVVASFGVIVPEGAAAPATVRLVGSR